MIKILISLLASRGAAIILLAVSIGLLALWRGNPDYYSPLFLFIPAFMFASISVCTLKRLWGSDRKNLSFGGSVVFHAGMLAVIASTTVGATVSMYGRVALPKGVTVTVGDDVFSKIDPNLLSGDEIPFLSIRLDDFETTYEKDRFPVRYTANLSFGILEDNGYRSMKKKVEINSPFDYGRYKFLLENGGYSPHFILTKEGKTLHDGYIKLSNETSKEDSYEPPGADIIIHTRFFPDFYWENEQAGTRSPVPKNPAFGIRINRKEGPAFEAPLPLWSGILKEGDKAEFKGMMLEFRDLNPYVVLLVVSNPSVPWLIGGFILITVGLVARYLPMIQSQGKT